jgi:hypothetical protein
MIISTSLESASRENKALAALVLEATNIYQKAQTIGPPSVRACAYAGSGRLSSAHVIATIRVMTGAEAIKSMNATNATILLRRRVEKSSITCSNTQDEFRSGSVSFSGHAYQAIAAPNLRATRFVSGIGSRVIVSDSLSGIAEQFFSATSHLADSPLRSAVAVFDYPIHASAFRPELHPASL